MSHLYYWDEGHGANSAPGDFIAWIAKISGYQGKGEGPTDDPASKDDPETRGAGFPSQLRPPPIRRRARHTSGVRARRHAVPEFGGETHIVPIVLTTELPEQN